MNKSLIPYFLYIFGTIAFTVYGQLILKWRIVKYGDLPERLTDKIIYLLKALLDPFILSGLFAAFIASLFWMAAMTKFDVSHAYPIIVGGLVILTSVFAIVFLREPVGFLKIFGITLIVAGVYFLTEGSTR